MAMLNKILPVLLLLGCATDTPTKTVIDDARVDIEQVADEIKKLPDNCRPDEFYKKLEIISGKLDAAEETHALEMRNCQLELDKSHAWNYGLFISLVVAAYLLLKKKLLP
jgi:hypothetical protein